MFSRLSERRRRRRAARDMARRLAELDRLDSEYGLGAMPSTTTSPRRARRHTSGPALLVTALVLGGIVVFSPEENALTLRRLLGFDDERLGAVPQVQEGQGPYSFMQTQFGSDEPVGYDPCRPVEIAVNPEGAPANHDELVATALERTAAATGLQLVRVADTDERDIRTGPYPKRRPALIMWAGADEVPQLRGDVAGIGGSVAAGDPGRLRYVTGRIVLDRDLFASLGPREVVHAQAIVDHELAHLVGLGHVDDPGELMHEAASSTLTFGPGDLEGLARLGAISC